MTSLPKPSFSTEEEILAGGKALSQASDTTAENVQKAVPEGLLLADGPYAHARVVELPDVLLYYIFRGKAVPQKFWGAGEFGLIVLAMAEGYWPVDRPKVEFLEEVCRPEVYGDDPRKESRYPEHFYGAYLVRVEGIDRKLSLRKEKVYEMLVGFEDEVKKGIVAWSNGG